MKFLNHYRSTGWIGALAALLLVSGPASAALINPVSVSGLTIGGFSPGGGTLTLDFSGDAGSDNILEEPHFGVDGDMLTTFTATYTDDGTNGSLSWGILDLGSLVYNANTGILETLSALNLGFIGLEVGGTVLDDNNYAEISDFSFGLLASSQQFPDTGNVPAPGTLLLLSLGLLALRKRRA